MNRQNRALTSLVIVLVALFATMQIAKAATPETRYDRPDYQAFDTPQNIFENQQAWLAYTNDIDDDWLESDAFDLATQAVGENFSATQEFLAFMDAGAFPTGACAQDFHVAVYSVTQYWALFYGAVYFNLTATVGEPIDTDPILDEIQMSEEYFFKEYISPKCWNKLDQ